MTLIRLLTLLALSGCVTYRPAEPARCFLAPWLPAADICRKNEALALNCGMITELPNEVAR